MHIEQIEQAAVEELREDRSRGAAQLARRALEVLAEASRAEQPEPPEQWLGALRHMAQALVEARPTLWPIRNLVGDWVRSLPEDSLEDPEAVRHQAARKARQLCEHSIRAGERIARHAGDLISADSTIFTHSVSSVVLSVFQILRPKNVKAIVTEGRPLYDGLHTARRLSEWGIPVTYITDAQMGLFVQEADFVVVGADAVTAGGDVINKAGTYLAALVANQADVPFYVVCESFKKVGVNIDRVELEEMAAEELDPPRLPGLKARNIYFDRTPVHLVTGWIHEDGIVRMK